VARLLTVKTDACGVLPEITAVLSHPSITPQAVRPFTIPSSPFSHIRHQQNKFIFLNPVTEITQLNTVNKEYRTKLAVQNQDLPDPVGRAI